jgi:hypothetical protein
MVVLVGLVLFGRLLNWLTIFADCHMDRSRSSADYDGRALPRCRGNGRDPARRREHMNKSREKGEHRSRLVQAYN